MSTRLEDGLRASIRIQELREENESLKKALREFRIGMWRWCSNCDVLIDTALGKEKDGGAA